MIVKNSRMFYLRSLKILMVMIFLTSCNRFAAKVNPNVSLKDSSITAFASDKIELEDISSFYQKLFFGQNAIYSTNWNELSQFPSGAVALNRVPYLDSWYPERTQGTNVNGALTSYDKAFYGGIGTAAKWELENNSRQEPDWFGHCNGTSVTVARFQNPLVSVARPKGCEEDPNLGCVLFSPSEIRALLAEINMNAKAKFISGNRCRLPESELIKRPALRPDPKIKDACDDVNPASFHIGLINFLGRQKQPVIFDQHRDEQVWNYPIYEYAYDAEGPLDEYQALEKIALGLDSWVFNEKVSSWYFVKMEISYREAANDFQGAGTKPSPSKQIFEYLLELDEEGNIIGGEWVGDSRTIHPDFLWVAFEPAEPSGSPSRGNPFVSNREVIQMWAESVGLDPESPFSDKPDNSYDVLQFPENELLWGSVEDYYQVKLDGRTNGAVFLGKKTFLEIDLADELRTQNEVDIFLNGKSLGRMKPIDGKISLTFDSPPGINYLNLKWYSELVSSTILDNELKYFATR